MKFGKQLQLSIYEPWKNYYIQYGKLKRIIKRLRFLADKEEERRQKGLSRRNTSANASYQHLPLSDSSSHLAPQTEMTPLNTAAMRRAISQQSNGSINDFADLENSLDFFGTLQKDLDKINSFYTGKLAELRVALESILAERHNLYRSHHTSADSPYLLRLRDIYVDLAALRSYIDLNKTGFLKIIKKYDKVMQESALESWKPQLEKQPAFCAPHEPLYLMQQVTDLVSRDKLIEWERFATDQQLKASEELFPAVRWPAVIFSLVFFFLSRLFAPSLLPSQPAANRCLSLLCLVVALWITEAVPYFATALMIPIFVVLMRVLTDSTQPDGLMTPSDAATFVLDHLCNHTTILLLGGYTLSTAFSRCQLELRLAAYLQERLGHHPRLFILAIMYLGLFLSMWISNHTAPILCATIILPVVRDLPTESRFSKALLLGLAFACNIGGMMTPIASLQNVLAVSCLEQLHVSVSFGQWLLFSIPFCGLSTFIVWVVLMCLIPPNDVDHIAVVAYDVVPVTETTSTAQILRQRKTYLILGASIVTLLSFAMFGTKGSLLADTFGDIAMVALCFVVLMFGSGMLSEVDFNALNWHTLFLVGGGNVLGKAIASSGLLGSVSDGITSLLPLDRPWFAFLQILTVCVVVASFVSHTVAALILLPVLASIGQTLGMAEVVVIGAALAVSAAMAFPFSSFPNVNSLLMVDDFQQPYLSAMDFLKTGIPMTLLICLLISTLGFVLIQVVFVGG